MSSQEASAPVDVLIADDDPVMRASLRLVLELAGYKCIEAKDGRQTVDQAQRSQPRCVLLDLSMPELDGVTIVRQLRADQRTRDVHIHCLTGRSDQDTRDELLQAGCQTYLIKPVDVQHLLAVVRPAEPSGEWVAGLNLSQARTLLDWLENNGCTNLEVSWQGEADLAVRCVPPPGARLVRDENGVVRLVPA